MRLKTSRIYSGFSFYSALVFLVAMAFFSAFAQLTQFILKSNQLSHKVQPSNQKYPADNIVLVDAKESQDSLYNSTTRSPSTAFDSTKKPHAIYDGGYETAKIHGVRLRIANGGAGQTGLIGAWADRFIQYMVSKGMSPFQVRSIRMYQDLIVWTLFGRQVAWYLGDTTDSLALLSSGTVDVALTYNTAAENQVLDLGDAVERVYGYRVSLVIMIFGRDNLCWIILINHLGSFHPCGTRIQSRRIGREWWYPDHVQ